MQDDSVPAVSCTALNKTEPDPTKPEDMNTNQLSLVKSELQLKQKKHLTFTKHCAESISTTRKEHAEFEEEEETESW